MVKWPRCLRVHYDLPSNVLASHYLDGYPNCHCSIYKAFISDKAILLMFKDQVQKATWGDWPMRMDF